MSVTVDAKTRLFARVRERLPIRLRVVSAEEAAELTRRIGASSPANEATAAPDDLDSPASWERAAFSGILERLEQLERKVQRIATTVGAVDDADGEWIDGETANISGGGLAVRVPTAPFEGSQIELDLALPGDPPARVRALGRVVYVLQPNDVTVPLGLHQLGVAFTAIHETDRETIVRYTFRLQRAQLREGREEGA